MAVEFKLERVTPSPAVFDWDKLNWLNRHYLKLRSDAEVLEMAWPIFSERGWLPPRTVADATTVEWFSHLIGIFLPGVDRLDQLTHKAEFMFAVDVPRWKAEAENAQLLGSATGEKVVRAFTEKMMGHEEAVTADSFKALMNEVKSETGAKGKDLFHPVRILLTGAHSGPEFDKLLPLMEAGAELGLPQPVLGVRERVKRWKDA